VNQVDCPEDAETYIHRVGRTARYNKGGKAMLLLLPSEIAMLDELKTKSITLTETEISDDKYVAVGCTYIPLSSPVSTFG
jgi:ATP-dependent RNA helicase DDX10/DBP4